MTALPFNNNIQQVSVCRRQRKSDLESSRVILLRLFQAQNVDDQIEVVPAMASCRYAFVQ